MAAPLPPPLLQGLYIPNDMFQYKGGVYSVPSATCLSGFGHAMMYVGYNLTGESCVCMHACGCVWVCMCAFVCVHACIRVCVCVHA